MIAATVSSLGAVGALVFVKHRVRSLGVADGANEVSTLLKRSSGQPLEALRALPSEAAQLAVRVLQAPTPAAARAELREAILDVASLKHLKRIPEAGGRVALTAGTLGAVIEIAQGLPNLAGPTIWASVAFGTGLCMWMVSNVVTTKTQTALQSRLSAWSELHRILEGHISGRWPENVFRNNRLGGA